MTNEEAKKRLEVWLKCVYCPEEKKCYDSYLHSTCEYTDYCDDVSIEEAIKVAIKDLEQKPCEDAISRKEAISIAGIATLSVNQVVTALEKLPPVNPQKPICPSAGVDCEDCPAYEDTISRKAVIDTLERMDKALDEDRTVENYKELLRECYKVLPFVSKPKTGHWIFDEILDKHYYCSECKSMGVDYWDYCPNCGAKMVELQEMGEEE